MLKRDTVLELHSFGDGGSTTSADDSAGKVSQLRVALRLHWLGSCNVSRHQIAELALFAGSFQARHRPCGGSITGSGKHLVMRCQVPSLTALGGSGEISGSTSCWSQMRQSDERVKVMVGHALMK